MNTRKGGFAGLIGLLGAHLGLAAASMFALFPVVWVVAMALDKGSEAHPTSLRLWPAQPSLDAFRQVLAHPTEIEGIRFADLALNSLLLAGGTAVACIALGACAAYAFSRFDFPGRRAGLVGFMVLQLFPPVASMAPLFVLLSALHLRTSLVGLALAYASGTLPFAIWNLKGTFDTVPRELEEAAVMDGCGPLRTFLQVVLPLAAPGLAVTTLFGFMAGWTEIVMAWTFLEDPRTFTLSMALYNMVGQYGTTRPWSEFAALSLLLSLPVVVTMLLLQRFIVSGLTAGSVKG
ncbi:MAG: ABC transporter permease subunit [Candidatus Sericytochromatia bacterium]|nr:ABC transporter permease subunit [Candidatus Sericytochromatia bacterium]